MNKRILYSYRDKLLQSLAVGSVVSLSMIPHLQAQAQAHTQGVQPVQLANLDQVHVSGELNEDHGEFHLIGSWSPRPNKQTPPEPLMSATSHSSLEFYPDRLQQRIRIEGDNLQGVTTNWVFDLRGDATIRRVTGSHIQSWSVTRKLDGSSQLELRLAAPEDLALKARWPDSTQVEIDATLDYADWNWNGPRLVKPLEISSRPGSLFQGTIQAQARNANLRIQLESSQALEQLLVEGSDSEEAQTLWYRALSSDYRAPFLISALHPEKRPPQFKNYQLSGILSESSARMTLHGDFQVDWPMGGSMTVLSGSVAVTDMFLPEGVKLEFKNGSYFLESQSPGTYPVRIEFDTLVSRQSGWSQFQFSGPMTELAPMTLTGLDASAQFQSEGMTLPKADSESNAWLAYGPASGLMTLRWKEAEVAEEGKLFYSAEGLSQIAVAAGLMRQSFGLEARVTQGEMEELALAMYGEGEVTSIQGQDVLNWEIQPATDTEARRIVVRLNQPKKDGFSLWIQTQTPMGPFPVNVEPVRLEPLGAIRYGGFLRVYNEGAVKLEARDVQGLSQISPGRYPNQSQFGGLTAGNTPNGAQVFAYRFSNADYQLSVQADHIVPELTVSQLLIYHVGESETAIQAEMEVDIREAPLREWEIQIPGNHVVSRMEAPDLADYFTTPGATASDPATLRMVFGSPLQGRRTLRFRLEKNQPEGLESWTLPRITPLSYKSLRGNIGVTADAGYRLSVNPETLVGLNETALAYFPRKEPGLQLTFRIRDEEWSAQALIERLAQTIQVDALHLFSLGEGVAYGSSVFHFLISGAPINSLQFQAPEDYGNIEFIAPNLRNWRKTENGYEIFFHSPVSGPISVLGNFDRKFSSPEDTLAFTGMQSIGSQSEQGYVVVTSDQPFQAAPAGVSDTMLSLEANELPEEYRLLVDTSILAAYQYTARPFELSLNITSLPQSVTVNQVVDRAEFLSRLTSGGQTLTEARLFVKSQGHSHLSITAPEGYRLWTVEVDGKSVTPAVGDNPGENLAPLPQNLDPDQVIQVHLQMGSENPSPNSKITQLMAPVIGAPMLYAEWKVETESRQGLRFVNGPIQPQESHVTSNGFQTLQHLVSKPSRAEKVIGLAVGIGILILGGAVWKITLKACQYRFTPGHWIGFLAGASCIGIGITLALFSLPATLANVQPMPSELNFVAPFQDQSARLELELERVSSMDQQTSAWLQAWPVILGLILLLAPTLESFKSPLKPYLNPIRTLVGTLIGWGLLNLPQGAILVISLTLATITLYWFAKLAGPLMSLPARPRPPKPPRPPAPPADDSKNDNDNQNDNPMKPSPSPSGATSLWILGGILALSLTNPDTALAQAQNTSQSKTAPYAQSIFETWNINNTTIEASAEILWEAQSGDRLPIRAENAVTRSIRIIPESAGEIRRLDATSAGASQANNAGFIILANEPGLMQIIWEYTPVRINNGETIQAPIPTPKALSHTIEATWEGLEWEPFSPQAVAIRTARDEESQRLVANLTLAPSDESWLGWKPRGRDTRTEQSVFYADLYHLLAPTSGALEGFHFVRVRPAQGQVQRLEFEVDEALTITNVRAPRLQTWRFDPDQNRLRIQLEEGQSQAFNLTIESQISASPLPYEKQLGLLRALQAANQIGMVGIATRAEAQLDSVQVNGLAAINLEDFPRELADSVETQDPLTLRRAYRTASDSPTLTLKVSAVQPDIRVNSEQTLSLGEDRILLAAQVAVDISRAGVFQLSFNLPDGMDVESVSGAALSHWTQSKPEEASDSVRKVILYLREKTEGRQNFSIQLVGPGIEAQSAWSAPKLSFNETSKSQGRLTLAPEQGWRLHLLDREAVTLLETPGAAQRSVMRNYMTFQILNDRWKLSFDIEQVPAWIQVNTLQEVTFKEGVEQTVTYYDYTIENAGIKSLRIQTPSDAESVRVEGESISDTIRVNPDVDPGTPQIWEVRFGKRILGAYSFSVRHQRPMQDQPGSTTLSGNPALNVNLQRGYLALRTSGRVQLETPAEPEGLQKLSDWQSLPNALRLRSGENPPNQVFRVMNPDFSVELDWTRYSTAKLDQAKIESIHLSSILSEGKAILTQVRMEILPGDLRALEIQLPESSDFWFAFVNQQSVAPWSVENSVLTPLEPSAIEGEPTIVEFLYSTPNPYGPGFESWRNLSAPRFGLPLENITWTVYAPESWNLTHSGSNFQYRPETRESYSRGQQAATSYLEVENTRQQRQVDEANQFFNLGNTLLEKGQNKDAMRAYETALNLSNNDIAFNEDARVQLDNVKMLNYAQGLNQRFQNVYGQELAQNQAESPALNDESVMQALARRLVEQQEAATMLPRAIRANLPEIGSQLVFEKALQADSATPLQIQLRFATPKSHQALYGWQIGAFAGLALLIALCRKLAAI